MMETAIRRAFNRLLKQTRACSVGMALVLGGALVMPTAPVAYGQNFEVVPFSAEMAEDAPRKAALDLKKSLLTGQSTEFGGEAGQKAAQYYAGFLVPAMTNPAFAERARKEIFTDIKTARTQEMRDLIIRAVEGPLKSVVDNEAIAPSNRVAALILLGELDTEQADFSAGKPPKPSRSTIAFLRTQLKKPNQLDGLLAAALVGMNRQTRYSSYTWQPAAKDAIADDLKSVLAQPKPFKRTVEAHAYLQRLVIESLSHFNSTKHGEVAAQLVTMLADEKQPMILRVAVCRAFPRWQLDSLSAEQRQQALAGAVYLAKSEVNDWLRQSRNPSRGASPMGGMGGLGAPMGGMPGMGLGDDDDGDAGLIGGGGRGAPMGGIGAPMGGMGAPGGATTQKNDKNLAELQDRFTNAARRRLYTVLESVYLALDGKTFALDRKPVGKGLAAYYVENDPLAEPTKEFLAEVDALYDVLGDRTVREMRSLASLMEGPIDKFNLAADAVPGMEAYKKVEETKKKLEDVADAAAGGGDGAPGETVAGGGASAPAADAPAASAPGADAPAAAGTPAGEAPAAGAPAAGAPAAGAPAAGGN